MKKIVVVNNHWSNIGNAFFSLSVIEDLKTVFSDRAEIIWGEGPTPYYNSKWSGSKKKFLDYALYTKADWYVFTGPFFDKATFQRLEPLFKNLNDQGAKIVCISSGSNNYNDEEIEFCRGFIKRYPIYMLSSRDRQTYEAYHDLIPHSYDGICSAFYTSIHFNGYNTPLLDPYIIMGFEQTTEPRLNWLGLEDQGLLDNVQINGLDTLKKISKLGWLRDYHKKYKKRTNDYNIVRPWHHPLSKLALMSFNRPNTFVSTNPHGYLNLYRNASLTLSQRVHACVPALSYGNPAMFCFETKRAFLFDRLNLTEIREKPVFLKKDLIVKEHKSFLQFLSSVPM